MTSRLKTAIANLYTVFSGYHVNSQMTGSRVYDDLAQWNKALYSKPLTELSDSDLSRFTGKAITTWGAIEDYKHFLPRIFELTAVYKTPYEIWIAFDKLECGNWNNWPVVEIEATNEYLIALFENLLQDDSERAEYNFEDYFSAIANFYFDFHALLELWEKTQTKASYKHLAGFIMEQHHLIFEKGKIGGFKNSEKNATGLKAWLLKRQTIEKIEMAYFEYESDPIAEKLSWAVQILSTELRAQSH